MVDRLHLGTTRAPAPGGDKLAEPRLQRALREFESLFMHELLKTMRSASALMSAEDEAQESGTLMNDLMDEQLSRVLVRGGGLGLAKILEAQLASRNGTPPAAAPDPPPNLEVDT